MEKIGFINKKIKALLSGRLIKNVGWLAGAEIANRVFRLATTVTLARLLSSTDYGLLAIIFTTIELANVFTLRGGIGSKLIQAKEENLEEISNTAYYLNWMIFGSIFLLQCLLAFPVAIFYDNTRVVMPICVVSLSYLIMPFFMVQGTLIQRKNQMQIIALANTIGSIIGNTITVLLALAGLGFWSVVISFLITQFSWLFVYLKYEKWRPSRPFNLSGAKDILIFAKNILGVELLDKFRSNADYLLVGRVLGTESLGLYYFAFNAGLGISMNVIGMFWYTVLPHLCSANGDMIALNKKYKESIKSMYMVVAPLIILQVVLAPIYVPLIFGQRWIEAIPILMIICLSALPRPLNLAASQLLISIDKGKLDLYWNIIFTSIFIISLSIAVHWGVLAVAICVLLTHVLLIPLFSIGTGRYVFRKPSTSVL